MSVPPTIAAIATPPGSGAVGIVRVSGPRTPQIAKGLMGRVPQPRVATFVNFRSGDGETIDQGIALFFSTPNSFTGEDILELQGHGGAMVIDLLYRRTLELGAQPARPGEFSERAYLNGKLDLVQAEAIADLIQSGTEVAARLACRTLQGAFSRRIRGLLETLVRLRTFLEAAIDFPDEEINFITESALHTDLQTLIRDAKAVIECAHQGSLVREGVKVVIAGPPNAGKSSLLNALAGHDLAIVTHIPGTTRDLLRQEIQIDGLPLHVVDTAGLRHSHDPIEKEGVRRAREQIEQADRVLWVFDAQSSAAPDLFCPAALPKQVPVTLIRNKIDLTGSPPGVVETPFGPEIAISVRTGAGMDTMREHLKIASGFHATSEGAFIARRRHLDALSSALAHIYSAAQVLEETAAAELVAEDLRLAQRSLGEITGQFTSEDLLRRIFAGFCIGK